MSLPSSDSNVPSLSRRAALQSGLAAGAALWGASALSPLSTQAADLLADKAADDKGWIDAHVHVWTPDVKKYPLASGYKVADMKPASFTPKELWDQAEPENVRRVVLIQMSFYGFDNGYMLQAIRDYPGRFAGVAVIDENDQPAEEMLRLKKHGVTGFRILPGGRPVEKWLDGPGMAEMWKCGAEENLAMCHLIDANSLPYVDKMCAKYPDTPVVIDHFARIGVDGKIRDEDVKKLCKLAQHERTSVKISAYYALGKKRSPYTDLIPMIQKLLDAYGAERLMWATDCPYQVDPGHNYHDSIALVRDHMDSLSEGDRDMLLRGTAERVFFGG